MNNIQSSLWTSKQLAKAIPGNETGGSFSCRGISIDSRSIKPGQAFLALKGDNFDGHDFVEEAVKNGASGVIVQNLQIINHPQIIVGDSHLALWKVAQTSRKRFKGNVVAISGSVGKTSLKEMLQFAYSEDGLAYSTPSNNNNRIGVPLAWANCPEFSKIFFVELGMNNKGEISSLSQLCKPSISVLTTVGKAHMKNFINEEGILNAKLEILNGMANDTNLIVIKSSEKSYNIVKTRSALRNINVFDIGNNSNSNIIVSTIKLSFNKISYILKIGDEEIQSTFNGFGNHWVYLIAGVVAVGKILGKDYKKAVEKLQQFQPQQGRGQFFNIKIDNKNISILDESYNASPESMNNMINTIGNISGSRKILVLGEMLELGNISVSEHEKIAISCIKSGINIVFCIGDNFKCLINILANTSVKVIYENNLDCLIKRIVENAKENDFIAIKGSKLVNLGEVVKYFNNNHKSTI